MFVRTPKVNHRKKKSQTIIEDHLSRSQTKSQNKYLFQTSQQFKQLSKKSYLHFPSQQPLIYLKSPSKDQRSKLINFQNQYLKKLAIRQGIIDQRKILIKQRIKDKVKQQLADLIKRSDFMFNSQTQTQKKDEKIIKSIHQVEVKGNSLQKTFRSSASQRLQLVKLQKIKKFNKRSISPFKQSISNDKIQLTDSSPRQKQKNRRSLSNFIRLHNISPSKFGRNVHSSIGGMYMSENRESTEIQPWNYFQEW